MNMPLIAAAAMAGGALLGFSLCWAATRLAGGNHAAAARLATTAKKKMGTMDKVLILEGVIDRKSTRLNSSHSSQSRMPSSA